MKEIIIDTKEKLQEWLLNIEYNAKIDRFRTLSIFRGMKRVDYDLKTSLERNCGTNPSYELKEEIEDAMLSNFSKYAIINDPAISTSIWRELIQGQHHGLPTRLLDWTQSLLVALHFATTESDYSKLDKHDCVVWEINIVDLKDRLPEEYRKLMPHKSSVFTTDILDKNIGTLKDYDNKMKDYNSMIVMEPPSIDQRIINQYSFFTIVPLHVADAYDIIKDMPGTVKYVIKKELRWYIRDYLDQYNISERSIYPGLDGTAKWIGRHYFVKDKK